MKPPTPSDAARVLGKIKTAKKAKASKKNGSAGGRGKKRNG